MPPRINTPSFRSLTILYRAHSKAYSTPSSSPSLLDITNLPAPHCGRIRVLSLNRPNARNAISRQLLAELRQQIDSLSAENGTGPTRALILASSVDSSFCAGADLKERATFTLEETQAFLASLRQTFAAISALPIPTISALAAPAFGGGLELALTTRFRVLASTSIVALPETRLGIIPGAGGTYRLPKLIGVARARDLILTGRRVSGPEAYFLGLCDRLVEIQQGEEGGAREKVLTEAVRLASEICEGAPIAINAALRAVEGWEAGEKMENACYGETIQTKDRDEALVAFREKRKPVFKGY